MADPMGQRDCVSWKVTFKGMFDGAKKLFGLRGTPGLYGNGFATREEVVAACRAHGAEEFRILQCADGTFVGILGIDDDRRSVDSQRKGDV